MKSKESKISYCVVQSFQCCFACAYSQLTEGGSSSVWEMYGIKQSGCLNSNYTDKLTSGVL